MHPLMIGLFALASWAILGIGLYEFSKMLQADGYFTQQHSSNGGPERLTDVGHQP